MTYGCAPAHTGQTTRDALLEDTRAHPRWPLPAPPEERETARRSGAAEDLLDHGQEGAECKWRLLTVSLT